MGIGTERGEQITYHLPDRLWDAAGEAVTGTLERAPAYDGHNSFDVIERLKKL